MRNEEMGFLGKLDEHRTEWIRYLKKMGAVDNIEDIIQDAYLRTLERSYREKVIKDNGKVNKTYFWCVLRTVFLADVKATKKENNVYFDGVEKTFKSEDEDGLREEAINIVLSKMHKEIAKLDKKGKYPYNKELFELYVYGDKSMRQIRGEVGISLSNVFTTIRRCKEQLSQELREDFEDLINEDYELIINQQ